MIIIITYIGRTALMEASKEGYDKIVSLLIEKGANMDLQDNHGESILYYVSTLYILH